MTIAYLGSLSLAVAIPGGQTAGVAGAAGINGALPDIEARLAALADFAPVNTDFAADLSFAQQTVAAMTLAINTPGLTPPSIAAQIAIVSALIASLEATVAAVNVNLAIVTSFLSVLTAAGVFGYVYSGPTNGLGAALSAQLALGFPGGLPGDLTNALVFATTTPATWDAMQAIFKVTP